MLPISRTSWPQLHLACLKQSGPTSECLAQLVECLERGVLTDVLCSYRGGFVGLRSSRTSTPSAQAMRQMLSMATFRSPRSTEL